MDRHAPAKHPSSNRPHSGSSSTAVDLGRGRHVRRTESYGWTTVFRGEARKSEMKYRANGARIRVAASGIRKPTTRSTSASRTTRSAIRFVVPGRGPRVPDAAMALQDSGRQHGVVARTARPLRGALREEADRESARRRMGGAAGHDQAAEPAGTQRSWSRICGTMPAWRFRRDGDRGYLERLGHSHPPGYPYTLRYGEENAKRLAMPASIEGPITTPWRVVIVRPRSEHTRQQRRRARASPTRTILAVSPGRPHGLAEARARGVALSGWRREHASPGSRSSRGWPASSASSTRSSRASGRAGAEEELADVIEYSKSQGVGIWLWRHSNTLGDRQSAESSSRVSRSRRGRPEGRLPRPRSEGSHRPVPGDPERRGRAQADDQLPRREQARRRVAARGRTK